MTSQDSRKRLRKSNANYEAFFASDESSLEGEDQEVLDSDEELSSDKQGHSSKKRRGENASSSEIEIAGSSKNTKPVWQFYKKMTDKHLKCKLCGLKLVSTHFNCLRHLKRKHPQELSVVETETSRGKTVKDIARMTKIKKIRVKINSAILLKSCVGLVTEDALSFRVFDSKNMRNITDPIIEGIEQLTGEKHQKINARNVRELVKKSAAQSFIKIQETMQFFYEKYCF
jgi:hypothetical protein